MDRRTGTPATGVVLPATGALAAIALSFLRTLVALATIPFSGALILQPFCIVAGIVGTALRLRWVHRDQRILLRHP
jgi:hypothetical protein